MIEERKITNYFPSYVSAILHKIMCICKRISELLVVGMTLKNLLRKICVISSSATLQYTIDYDYSRKGAKQPHCRVYF